MAYTLRMYAPIHQIGVVMCTAFIAPAPPYIYNLTVLQERESISRVFALELTTYLLTTVIYHLKASIIACLYLYSEIYCQLVHAERVKL